MLARGQAAYFEFQPKDSRRARSYVEPEDAVTATRAFAEAIAPYRSTVDDYDGGFKLEVETSFATSATAYVSCKGTNDRQTGCLVTKDSNGATVTQPGAIRTFHWVAELSWGSTGRSVAEAVAAIAIYNAVTNWAALVETRLNSEFANAATFWAYKPRFSLPGSTAIRSFESEDAARECYQKDYEEKLNALKAHPRNNAPAIKALGDEFADWLANGRPVANHGYPTD